MNDMNGEGFGHNVRPGQQWRSRDKRDDGKTVTVESVDQSFAYVRGAIRTRIRIAADGNIARYELVGG